MNPEIARDPWVVELFRLVAAPLADAVFYWPDDDERAYLARHIPRGRRLALNFDATPDSAILEVLADLSDFGRGLVSLARFPVTDRPEDIPLSILPDYLRAQLVELVAAAEADMPAVPDSPAELLGGT